MNESTASMGMMILWMVVIFGVMYFLMIRPQKKEPVSYTHLTLPTTYTV